jgi:Cu-Zn family superoxide dismutase
MHLLFSSRRSRIAPFLFTLFVAFALSACATTEEAADETTEAADDVGQLAEEAAEETADVAEDVGDFVVDASGTAWNSVTDLFDDDPELDDAALVRPTSAGTAEGTARFYEMDDELRVAVSLRGLDPGAHGIHIHQNASCADADTDNDGQLEAAGAAGGHWDPVDTDEHGAPAEEMDDKHAGDLGNIDVGADGMIESTFTVPNFPADEYDVSGHALVVHAGRDDLETDPAGDSGTRVGCGIIESR